MTWNERVGEECVERKRVLNVMVLDILKNAKRGVPLSEEELRILAENTALGMVIAKATKPLLEEVC